MTQVCCGKMLSCRKKVQEQFMTVSAAGKGGRMGNTMKKITDNLRKLICGIVFLALLVTFPAGMPGIYTEEAYDLIVPGADSRYYTAVNTWRR